MSYPVLASLATADGRARKSECQLGWTLSANPHSGAGGPRNVTAVFDARWAGQAAHTLSRAALTTERRGSALPYLTASVIKSGLYSQTCDRAASRLALRARTCTRADGRRRIVPFVCLCSRAFAHYSRRLVGPPYGDGIP